MEDEAREYSIDGEISRLLAEQDDCESDSKEYKDRNEYINTLYSLRIRENQADEDYEIRMAEIEFKREELEATREANNLKREELKEAKKSRWSSLGETLIKASIVVGATVFGGTVQYKMHQEDNMLKQQGYIVKDSTRVSFLEKAGNFFTKFM